MKEDLIRLSSDYSQFLEVAEINPELEKIKDLIFEIIAYCDNRAKDKSKYNQYEDDRILADASVRMGNWVDGILKFKFKHQEIQGRSILNALNYLLNPQENTTILSENYRTMIAQNLLKKEYQPESFVHDLKAYFDPFGFHTKNSDNLTFLIANILYEFSREWKDDVVGLMASDGTGWHDENLFQQGEFEGIITWNSKKPSGGTQVIKFLKAKLKEGESFPLFYSSKGKINYRANVIDFAISEEEYQEKDWATKKIKFYREKFSDHKDSNKSAKIVFLADRLEKIDPIPVNQFVFFGKYMAPRQDNLSPIKEISVSEIKIQETDGKPPQNKRSEPLNQILFGPPGTGKTYHTVNEALRIVGEEIGGKTREEIKEVFDSKVKEGQIVFTTFHQSMSYEDFIEGIKPIEPEKEEGQVIYRVEPGIFRKLCIEASFDIAKVGMSQETAVALDFSNLYDLFIEEVEEKLSNQKDVKLKTKSEGTVLIDSISQPGNIIIKHPKGERTYTVSKARLTKLNSSIKDLDEVSNINDEFRSIIGGSNSSAYWAVLNGIRQITKRVSGKLEDKTYTFSDKVEVVNQMTKDDHKATGSKRFVLIIDEINRGNVSQIFGELITLIEEDKRLGRDEALEVTLPYSKEKFGVPANLYLIGTMNTADRSVEALDTALRRRFSFAEMPPKPDLLESTLMLQRVWMKYEKLDWNDPDWVMIENDFFALHGVEMLERKTYKKLEGENDLKIPKDKFKQVIEFGGVDLKDLLITLNRRIEKLLDRDHLIGHSYFIKVYSWEDLKETFYKNIIPLLQEYFFGDYAKIGAVLGKGFVKVKNGNAAKEEKLFAEFDEFDAGDFEERATFEIVDYKDKDQKHKIEWNKNTIDMDFEKSIKLLMNLPIE